MSDARWCDHGNHPFSALETGKQTIAITIDDVDQFGRTRPVTMSKEVCGPCAKVIALLTLPKADDKPADVSSVFPGNRPGSSPSVDRDR